MTRFYVEVNPDLTTGFIISFNSTSATTDKSRQQVVHHIIYSREVNGDHAKLMMEWIKTHKI